ncbi:MAG: dCTP deaminase [Candidatus Pacebacteria bacterium CG_4_10_14_0_8_um_filter_43_12]|nr:MAG: dCTP deaminase [Candidatus Pacebacteria bacterium CG10_big_fil_rev_8_21_14_0_10_44_11]PIY79111.1 MAG: dCTP deaminase [Candidatus Pacebacteria bacterium CG_4_10_14_0_8_um_filter_43_12]
MYLSDVDIKQALKDKEIVIKDFDESRLQPASYDILLGFEFMVFQRHTQAVIDPKKPAELYMEKIILKSEADCFILHPNEFALAVTYDYFGVGPKYCCNIMGKSSLARLGLIIHTTAGFVDPGNQLNATLELYNTNSMPIKLYPKMRIAQIAFCALKSPAAKPYGHASLGSKYFKSKGVEASRMSDNFVEK